MSEEHKVVDLQTLSFDIQTLSQALHSGAVTPIHVVHEVLRRIG